MEQPNPIFINEPNNIVNLRPQDLTINSENVNNRIIPHFTKDEIKLRLERVPPGQNGMILQFLWRTGCRVTECVSLKKQDLNFQNDEIMIRWLKNRKYLYRTIPMHSSLKHPLYLYTANIKYDERIFPITRQRVDQVCKQYRFDHAHKIRHSYAIYFLRTSDSPMALMELKELLGHAKIETTMMYLKVVPMQLKKSISKIDFD